MIATFKPKIESISDILEIIQRPSVFLKEILNVADSGALNYDPLGRADSQYPRPFPYGIWFRGQQNKRWTLDPAAFRTKIREEGDLYYDERNMFHDLRLRTTDFNSVDFSNFDIMCMMRHHTLPTRVLDWSENILVATFFAIRDAFQGIFNNEDPNRNVDAQLETDPALVVINTYRLNGNSSILRHVSDGYNPGMLIPDDIDVTFRAACADHTYFEDVLTDVLMERRHRRAEYVEGKLLDLLESHMAKEDIPEQLRVLAAQPVAVMPKRANPRMDAQLSTFTIHGGKRNYFEVRKGNLKAKPMKIGNRSLSFMPKPISLEELNDNTPQKFLKKFIISRFSVKRIMIELDRIGISEPMLFPEMDNQAEFVKRRWSVISDERAILNLPAPRRRFDHKKRTDVKTMEQAEIELYGRLDKNEKS